MSGECTLYSLIYDSIYNNFKHFKHLNLTFFRAKVLNSTFLPPFQPPKNDLILQPNWASLSWLLVKII